jgi:hypothetical protein
MRRRGARRVRVPDDPTDFLTLSDRKPKMALPWTMLDC